MVRRTIDPTDGRTVVACLDFHIGPYGDERVGCGSDDPVFSAYVRAAVAAGLVARQSRGPAIKSRCTGLGASHVWATAM